MLCSIVYWYWRFVWKTYRAEWSIIKLNIIELNIIELNWQMIIKPLVGLLMRRNTGRLHAYSLTSATRSLFKLEMLLLKTWQARNNSTCICIPIANHLIIVNFLYYYTNVFSNQCPGEYNSFFIMYILCR